MAKYRQIHLSFWQDPFVEDLEPLEKFFYLYLMTNSKTAQCGCYEISMKLIRYETGLTQKQVDKYILTLKNAEKIHYNKKTSEFLLLNWLKHNSFKSPRVRTCIDSELLGIKHTVYIDYIKSILTGNSIADSLSILCSTPIDRGLQEEQEEEQKKEQEGEEEKKKKAKQPKEPSFEEQLNRHFEEMETSDILQESVLEFIEHRKAIKKPMTFLAVTKIMKKLSSFGYNDVQKIKCLDNSIANGWQGIFELKDQGQSQTVNNGSDSFTDVE